MTSLGVWQNAISIAHASRGTSEIRLFHIVMRTSVETVWLMSRKERVMKIDISQNDFGTLCICALRYCHGRRTYMPSLVQQIVSAHFKDLSDRDLKVIADSESFQNEMNLFGDMCDKTEWDNFYQKLREYRAEQTEPKTDCAWK